MKKYKILFTFILMSGYLLNLYIQYAPLDILKKVYLKDLSMNIEDINKTVTIDIESIFATTFKDWGLRKSFLLLRREAAQERLAAQIAKIDTIALSKKDKKIIITNRTICLEKKCWEFMGIFKVNNKVTVTLLSKDKKSKLETFKIGSTLLENLKIINIKSNMIVLFDIKKNKKFYLKLFDVDIKKYYPKAKIKRNLKEVHE